MFESQLFVLKGESQGRVVPFGSTSLVVHHDFSSNDLSALLEEVLEVRVRDGVIDLQKSKFRRSVCVGRLLNGGELLKWVGKALAR